ncbi:hypothetical protein V5O48_004633 [Marasmius crinis-equi]|uniref:Uncharacterized protein n=1 Tax=Marasmius crinis-equi TaxID=585013 RepID=A0ABR3FPL8_9AGAR
MTIPRGLVDMRVWGGQAVPSRFAENTRAQILLPAFFPRTVNFQTKLPLRSPTHDCPRSPELEKPTGKAFHLNPAILTILIGRRFFELVVMIRPFRIPATATSGTSNPGLWSLDGCESASLETTLSYPRHRSQMARDLSSCSRSAPVLKAFLHSNIPTPFSRGFCLKYDSSAAHELTTYLPVTKIRIDNALRHPRLPNPKLSGYIPEKLTWASSGYLLYLAATVAFAQDGFCDMREELDDIHGLISPKP